MLPHTTRRRAFQLWLTAGLLALVRALLGRPTRAHARPASRPVPDRVVYEYDDAQGRLTCCVCNRADPAQGERNRVLTIMSGAVGRGHPP